MQFQMKNLAALQGVACAGMAGGAGVAVGEIPRRPELAEEMEKLATAIGYNEELTARLHDRLGGVLRQGATAGQDSYANPAPSTQYGQQLSAGTARIAVQNARLLDMLDRLEA